MIIFKFSSERQQYPELFLDNGLPKIYLYIMENDFDKFNQYLQEYQAKLGGEKLTYLTKQGIEYVGYIDLGILEACFVYRRLEMLVNILQRLSITYQLPHAGYLLAHVVLFNLHQYLKLENQILDDELPFMLSLIDTSLFKIGIVQYETLIRKLSQPVNRSYLRKYSDLIFKYPEHYVKCGKNQLEDYFEAVKRLELEIITELQGHFSQTNFLSIVLAIVRQQTELIDL